MKCRICGKEFTEIMYNEEYQDICSSECFSYEYWNERVRNKEDFTIINGICYVIGNSNLCGFKGFSGAKFKIQTLESNKIIETDNLWYNGEIPNTHRHLLPDNAIFIECSREPKPAKVFYEK